MIQGITVRQKAAAFSAAFVFAAGVAIALVPAKSAHAATGCGDGDRGLAASLASSGNYVEAVSTWSDSAKITLRYSSDTGCAWGLLSDGPQAYSLGLQTGYIWLDRSSNGGATWQGKLGERSNEGQRSTYTGTFNTINYNSIRACSVTSTNGGWADTTGKPPFSVNTPVFGAYYCTPWFFPGRLASNQTMGGRGFTSLSSPNNRYVLRMQDDGNFVLYSWGRAVWSSNTFVRGSIAKMQSDGNLVVIAPGNRPVWASNSYGPGAIFVLQDDGNMVVVAPGGRVVWASGTNGR